MPVLLKITYTGNFLVILLISVSSQAARAICTVASKVGSNMEDKHFVNLKSMLVNGLSGRTWEGKEYLLDALAILCKNSK